MTFTQLKELSIKGELLENQALSDYTFTRTGGKADILAFPEREADLKTLILWAGKNQVPVTILGNASNLIVKDGGIEGLVIILTEMKDIEINATTVRAQAGARLIDVSEMAGEKSLTGLEFACGIPGSIGGAVYMNAGAYGGEVSDVIESVRVMNWQGEVYDVGLADCHFSYRHSGFQDGKAIILGVTFKLKKGNLTEILNKMKDLTFQRQSKQPLEYPSCGSVFKRPSGYFTGQLIQEAGLQGYQIGGAQVSKKHAGFIVNIDNATASDYIQLIQYIQKVIWNRNQVALEPEVRIIGRD